jgi:hypothetical protein
LASIHEAFAETLVDKPILADIDQRHILPALVVGDIVVPDSAWYYSLLHNHFPD